MSEPSGWQAVESRTPSQVGDGEVVDDLLCWGHLLEALTGGISPVYQLEDLLATEHPLRGTDHPLAGLVATFGHGQLGQGFLTWWLGREAELPKPTDFTEGFISDEALSRMIERLYSLEQEAETAFRAYTVDWVVTTERLARRDGKPIEDIALEIDPEVWERIGPRLQRSAPSQKPLADTLDHAIARVRSFFEPLESPLFGMNPELLAHHVRETIPREVPGETVPPIVPLFGKHQRHQNFSAAGQLPTHLRVVLRRLERSLSQGEVVTGLLAMLEAVDFTLRLATGLAQGCWSIVSDSEMSGSFDPSTAELIADLGRTARNLRSYWDHPHAQPALHLLFRGRELNPFLDWAGLEAEPRLLAWMLESEEAIREDNPARCAALSDEVSEGFAAWIGEFALLCAAWDVVLHTRQDGYLGISVARGPVGVNCKPLVDPTRYSVWLDRSEIAAINSAFDTGKGASKLEPLDPLIMLCSNDPPLLSEQISELLKAHEQGQVLPVGRSLFQGLEYLVRLHASLAGGFLRHHLEETSFLDPVLKPGGSLQHAVYFLSYAQRILADIDDPGAKLLRSVFFADGEEPRRITKWLGIDSGVPGPLQGLIGWSLSLMRPDAANRLDEIRDQIPTFSSLFAEFVQASRDLWGAAWLQTEPGSEGAQATVCQFPSGLRIRGIPDIVVGHRVEDVPMGVVIGGAAEPDRFSHWESEDGAGAESQAKVEDQAREDSSFWPSFFEDAQGSPRQSWDIELARELEVRCLDHSFSGPEGRPYELAKDIASFIEGVPANTSTISLVRGEKGSGRTLLCRTLVHPEHSPLAKDFPVLYLKVDRFPETRLSTVVERLNDHIASESSLDRFSWVPVPTETLQSLGIDVDRLSKDLAELGQHTEPLASRLSSYLRCLKKLNDGRDFLLLLDGFESVPPSIVPKVLSPGIHLLITGSEFTSRGETGPYVQQQYWDLSQESTSRAAFGAQLAELGLDPSKQRTLFHRFGGSLLKARAFANLRENQDGYGPNPAVLDDLLAYARRLFPEPDRREAFSDLLCTLGLYERPVPLRILEALGIDVEVANIATNSLPSLFSFWNEPEPALGLSHRIIFEMMIDGSGRVETVAESLAREFINNPGRGDLMPALRWLSYSGIQAELIEQVFANSDVLTLWREELAKLWREGLYFQRVALLDATEEPLLAAIDGGAGHLREELGWLHNARGLSLLKLGLLEDASTDLQIALERFQTQFSDGEMAMISSIGSATNRLSEVALKSQDLGRAASLSDTALTILEEGRSIADSPQLRGLMAIALMQKAQIGLRERDHLAALNATETANELLHDLDPTRFAGQIGEVGWYRAEALAGLGQTELAIRELGTTVEQLFRSGTVESGLQALLLRARLQKKLGARESAYADLDRALSILRYRVFAGRLDLEPLQAYTAARRALTGAGSPDEEGHALTEFVEWARHCIRFEGRSDLRALLAYILLARGQCWKDAGSFAKAVDDLRAATEQYDLLSSAIKKADSEPVWNGLRQAFAQMTSLYVSLDEAPLAILAGRRALELAQRATRNNLVFESGLEVPTFSLIAPSDASVDSDFFEGDLYQTAKLYFHLGEATRRLNLEKFASAYFEQAANGFERLLAGQSQAPMAKLEEYRVVLKYVAKSSEARRDFAGLSHWVGKLQDLPSSVLTDFDRFSIYNWMGSCLAYKGDLEGALVEYRAGLESLKVIAGHPRYVSLRAETLLELGRVLSLKGQHAVALEHLEQANTVSQNALFEEGEENRELLIRSALHLAVAHLRAGHQVEALDQLRILVSYRPLGGIAELEQLTDDWVAAWQESEPLALPELLRRLTQMCELGDWLLRTPLGLWFRELVTELVTHHGFSKLIWDSHRLDQVIETFLVVAFSQAAESANAGFRGTSVSETGELQRLLKAKYRALEKEGRLIEAELALSHMLPARSTPTSGRLLLLRSEMALQRGDRGVGIVDLLRATESRGKAKVQAHLRLAEFLLSRDLQAATSMHLRRSLFSIDDNYGDLWQMLERVGSLMTGLVRSGAQLEAGILEEYLRVCRRDTRPNHPLVLDTSWLKALGDYREWPQLIEATLALLAHRQSQGADNENDWRFLEEVMERTLLCSGGLNPVTLKELGKLLVVGGVRSSEAIRAVHNDVWNRFVGLLPALGRRDGFALLQRLFEYASGRGVASAEGRAAEFLARLEEEKRLLSQPT
jgi:tetratricopeptide (TPR) repeat protein